VTRVSATRAPRYRADPGRGIRANGADNRQKEREREGGRERERIASTATYSGGNFGVSIARSTIGSVRNTDT